MGPSLRKVFFDQWDHFTGLHNLVGLPDDVLWNGIERRFAFQVRHKVSPKILFQILRQAGRYINAPPLDNFWRQLRNPSPELFAAVNSLENSVIYDGRIGYLLDDYQVSPLSNPSFFHSDMATDQHRAYWRLAASRLVDADQEGSGTHIL